MLLEYWNYKSRARTLGISLQIPLSPNGARSEIRDRTPDFTPTSAILALCPQKLGSQFSAGNSTAFQAIFVTSLAPFLLRLPEITHFFDKLYDSHLSRPSTFPLTSTNHIIVHPRLSSTTTSIYQIIIRNIFKVILQVTSNGSYQANST